MEDRGRYVSQPQMSVLCPLLVGLTISRVYPLAVSVVGESRVAHLPMTVGFILDRYKSYDPVFAFFSGDAILLFILVSFLDEPILAGHQ